MDDQELLQLLRDIESDRVERKESAADMDRIAEAICAFANDLPNHRKPGILFIGAKDNGSCAGLPVTDQLLQNLADLRSNGKILPFPSITVQKRLLGGCEIAVILVHPSDSPPVRFRGRTWIRVGPRRALATQEEERRLMEKRRSGNLPFDLSPVQAARLSDLNLDLFRRVYLPSALAPDVLEHDERPVEQQLAALRFGIAGMPFVPTTLGMLVCGERPRSLVPGAYVQFLRINGPELTDPIKDQKEIDGPLPELMRKLDELFQTHISVSSDLTSSSAEVRRSDYPMVALQQLSRNAILHRTYEGTHAPVRITWFRDRIEIHSPGGPFGQVNRRNFGEPGVTDYRNPNLAEAVKNLGFIQRFGVGIATARRALETNGNPPLEFVVEDTSVLARLRRNP